MEVEEEQTPKDPSKGIIIQEDFVLEEQKPMFSIIKSDAQLFLTKEAVTQLVHETVHHGEQIDQDSDRDHSVTGMSWDQDYIDKQYAMYNMSSGNLDKQ